jgi:hypothetical protein
MVSSVLGMTDEELLAALHRIREESADDPEYRQLRDSLPAEWPM